MDPLLVVLVDRVWEDVCLFMDAYDVYKKFDMNFRPPAFHFFVALAELLQHGNSYLQENSKRKSAHLMHRTVSVRLDLMSEEELARLSVDEDAARALSLSAQDAGVLKGAEQKDEDEEDADLKDLLRVVATSVLSDVFVFPFWAVKVSAVAGRARVPGIFPFSSYWGSFQAIRQAEGVLGIWKGAKMMCVVGLLHNFHRIHRTLHLTGGPSLQSGHPASSHGPNDKRKKGKRHSQGRLIYEMSERGSLQQRIVWSLLLHPLELIAVRMITESKKEYLTWKSSYRYICSDSAGWWGLFTGTKSTLINAIIPYGGWCLLGIPFLIKYRRMLDGYNKDIFGLLRETVQVHGLSGLFCGISAAFAGLLPSLSGLVGARLFVQIALGTAPRRKLNRAKRKEFYHSLLMKIIPVQQRKKMDVSSENTYFQQMSGVKPKSNHMAN